MIVENELNNRRNIIHDSDDISIKITTQNNKTFEFVKDSHRTSLDDQIKDMENALKKMNYKNNENESKNQNQVQSKIPEQKSSTGQNFKKPAEKERTSSFDIYLTDLPLNKTSKPNLIENFYKKNNVIMKIIKLASEYSRK